MDRLVLSDRTLTFDGQVFEVLGSYGGRYDVDQLQWGLKGPDRKPTAF